MSTHKKIIAVLGATGTQGGGVIRSLIKDDNFSVRAITRNPSSPSSEELKNLGVEVVKADLDDTPSLTEAFKGCYGVFGVTDFWTLFAVHKYDQPATAAHETQQGKNLVDAAKAAGVKSFVWSTLDHGGDIHCFHSRSKYNVNAYLQASGIPYTLLYTACFYSNLVGGKLLKAEEDGSLTYALPVPPETKVHYVDGSDLGRWVVPILKNQEKYNGKEIHAVSEYIDTREVAKIITRASGKKCNYLPITKEAFYTKEVMDQIGNELWLNLQLWVEDSITRDFEGSQAVGPNPVNLEVYINTNPQVREVLGLK